MWDNLKNWQKSGIILVLFFIVFYVLGILFVPIEGIDHSENYKWPPLIYSIFLMLPILIIKYSQKKLFKIIAGIILGIFIVIIAVPLIFNWSHFYNNTLAFSSGNPLVTIFSMFYVASLIGPLMTIMLLFGLSM